MGEAATHGILNSPVEDELFADLTVPLVLSERSSRRRYVFREGRPRRWPLQWGETLQLLLRWVRTRGLRAPHVEPLAGETVVAWCHRVLTPAAARYALGPALQGI